MQNQLFDQISLDNATNVLPKDGCAHYFPGVFDPNSSEHLFKTLLHSLDWQADQLVLFGKSITTGRKVVWVGDEGCSYTYSGVKKNPQPWTPTLLAIKREVQAIAKCEFNSCLLNLYHDGTQGMGWHSDDEKELVKTAPIASLSLGAERKFTFRHKADKTSTSLVLENGSLLLMHSPTQAFWHHSLVKTTRPLTARINLTFRQIRAA
jgi:alkylated DNA repair dioxygenase AlkB